MTQAGPPQLRIGRVLKAHGVKGEVRIELLTDFPDRFQAGERVEVEGKQLTVERSRELDGSLLLQFREVQDRSTAETLVGSYCTLPLSAARQLPSDHYYHFQLVGLDVFDARQQRRLGRVAEVLSYPANDVLRVTDGGRELLVPMVKSIVREIQPEEGRLVVDLPEEVEA